MKYNRAIFTIFVILQITSCISIKKVTIEIKEPAEISFPSEIVNIAVVDNSYIEAYTDSISKDSQTITIDSARINLTKYFAKYIKQENYFGQVIYYPNNRSEYSSTYDTLSKEEIINICNQTQTDALVNIDECTITGLETKHVDIDDGYYQFSIGVRARLHVFRADGSQIAPVRVFSDTLYWNGYLPELYMPYFTLSKIFDESLNIAVMQAADNLANIYAPYWKKEQRKYYTNSTAGMKKAAEYIENNKWENAAETWEHLYHSKKRPLKKCRLSYNIAVAYECMDDIENALKWNALAESWARKANNVILNYDIAYQQLELVKRKKQLDKLKIQYTK